MERTPVQSNRQIAHAAGTVMLAFIFSQLVGLATKILIARVFNAQVELDAFYVSNRPSETLLTIMAGGILASSFIPIFVKFLVKQDRQSAWKLASGTANTILVILTVLAGLMALLANPIIRYLLGVGFPPEKQALAVDLLRIQALSVIFFGLSALVIGILNSNQKFLMSALAPAMYQLGQILGILFLAPSMGIYGLAWGVVLGSVHELADSNSFSLEIKRTIFLYLRHTRFLCNGSFPVDAASHVRGSRRPVDVMGKYPAGFPNGLGNGIQSLKRIYVNDDGSGRDCSVCGHCRYAHLFSTICTGQI